MLPKPPGSKMLCSGEISHSRWTLSHRVQHAVSVFTLCQGHPEGARAAGQGLHLPDGKEMGQSEEEIQGDLFTNIQHLFSPHSNLQT